MQKVDDHAHNNLIDEILDGENSQQRGGQHGCDDRHNDGGENGLRYGSDEGCRKGCGEHLALNGDVDDTSTLTHNTAQSSED